MSIIASIDIGTNSTRLLIAEKKPDGSLTPLKMIDTITRLGKGFDAQGNLSQEAMMRVVHAIADYKTIIEQYKAEKVKAFATSATRDAQNRDAFFDLILSHSGIKPRLLSGDTEALMSFNGAMSDFEMRGNYLVCDIGGGSTEFIFARDNNILKYKSLDIGSRRLTTRFIHNDPPTQEEADKLRSFTLATLKNQLEPFQAEAVIFVGGTATTLAMMDRKIDIRNGEQSHKSVIEKRNLQNILADLFVKTIQERKQIIGLHPDRSDVIFTGATLVDTILEHFQLSLAHVSLRDLMFGVLLENE